METKKPGESRRENIEELTGLRGVAALFVLLSHFVLLAPQLRETSANLYLRHFGVVGMSLFFTLSGFVIYYNYAERICQDPRGGIKKFLIARFARLYPLYFVFVVGGFLLNLLFSHFNLNSFSANLVSLPAYLLGVQSWFYGYVNGIPLIFLQGFVNISWSISAELALYLFFLPFAFIRIGSLKKVAFLCGLVLLGRCLYVYLSYFGFQGISIGGMIDSRIIPHQGYYGWIWLVYHSPYGRIFEFLVGCLSAKFYLLNNNKFKSFFKVLALFSIVLLSLNVMDVIKFELSDHLLIPLSLMLFVFSVVQCRSKILRTKFLLFIGEISYSTYLLHIVFVQVLSYTGSDYSMIFLRICVLVVATYVTAYFSYKYIENPARRFIRARFH
ncbi:acyltransferase family protein [Desulfobaculum bizertense]|uniref:Peptidoglycan/LPS O-acetylase OafA/YrhL, contains acyltransferase and SGNH-hydrolase domains n=1 Tax=Desulfobaculum bizertense DSM 18034 TaxID=1121442 RepID=A0A1T4WWJ4_9BACT|nr:acyltransferase [Desulfobaculum bizertense]SKA81674.1 Peptidoglycan/LPS O-acetylase OafA/YrhL, contains acyltransferase and SGNH-hydrolase domains [Desulfobaculum bizertense DSM 18034]